MANNQQQLGKYELQERLGRGGMAEVWKAFDPQLRRHVAIKFLQANLRTDPDFMIRFVREAQVIASLHHPNIVQVYDFHTPGEGDDSSMPYMVMDYIEGGQTLADYIRNTSRKGLFPSSEELLHLFTAITLAVDYAHQHNMIHRDIKPANILLDKRNVTHNPMGEPILSDFGIVKMLGTATGTLTSSSIGTPLYVSPEQAQGHPGNERSDIYSLGVVLYEMCTGVPPFRGDGPYAIMMQHVHENPTPPRLINQEIPAALEVVILRCLAKDPTARFPRATSLAAALAEALNLPVPEAVKRIATYPLDPTEQPTYFSPLPDQVEAAAARQSASASPNRAVHQTPGPVSVAKKASERTEYHAPAAVANTPSSLPTVAQAEQAAPASRPSRASETPPPAGPLPTSSPFQAGGNRPRPLFIALAAFIIIVALIGTTLFFLLPRPGSTAAQNGPAAGQNQSVGSAFFVDSGQSNPNSTITSDSFSIRLTNIPDPAPGNAYYAWLPPTMRIQRAAL
ncbi:serine/threonine protein kinase [Ktedonosporobacter rubrisoli]|uniref:non-specific serine/threonine protein kinase n=1 Tax=Ktedonosporobacter rubrisoli TaxID=2509675 RepID=A0A4P6JUF8_KTERU|nr:serine/threonine-protein kinase [Ktedonosporobacter rubrisoli]QBD79269.1 serine/threonine protein kinase [Ktedonosporobacter rubrisoli]